MRHIRSPEQIIEENVSKMGKELGEQYSALWQEAAYLHSKWGEYVELFGTKPSRIELLNEAAPEFFGMMQNEMWKDVLLHLVRLTDFPKSVGRQNLTVQNLPSLVRGPSLERSVAALVDVAVDRTTFCRDWRNRIIAHQDLDLAMDRASTLLKEGSRRDVSNALAAIVSILDAVSLAYLDAGVYMDATSGPGGALNLLCVLNDGLRAHKQRQERIEQDKYTEEDFAIEDI